MDDWIRRAAGDLGVDASVIASLRGVVFEVRQGYKSKDSKRQNADLANAASAYTHALLPCVVVLSGQIDTDIQIRYRNSKWSVLTGRPGQASDLSSTYEFMKSVVGFDMSAFFAEHSSLLRREVDKVLRHLLTDN